MNQPALHLLQESSGDQASAELSAERKEALANEARSLGFVVEGDDAMLMAFHQMKIYAGSNRTVLIRGETGAGKEPAARAMHALKYNGKGKDMPFFDMNCASVSDGVFESELFGHRKGAFTSAIDNHTGAFGVVAEGGTLFLDEIGDMPKAQQAKLLRVLQERSFRPVGHSGAATKYNGRVVCATRRPLEDLIENDAFRSDLYQRIIATQIVLPTLEERSVEHKNALVEYLSQHIPDARAGVRLTAAAKRLFVETKYAGNVRGLQLHIERAYLQAEAQTPSGSVTIDAQHVAWSDSPVPSSISSMRHRIGKTMALLGGEMVIHYPPEADHEGVMQIEVPLRIKDSKTALPRDMSTVVRVIQGSLAEEVLRRNGDNQSAAASALDITRGSLRSLVREIAVVDRKDMTHDDGPTA